MQNKLKNVIIISISLLTGVILGGGYIHYSSFQPLRVQTGRLIQQLNQTTELCQKYNETKQAFYSQITELEHGIQTIKLEEERYLETLQVKEETISQLNDLLTIQSSQLAHYYDLVENQNGTVKTTYQDIVIQHDPKYSVKVTGIYDDNPSNTSGIFIGITENDSESFTLTWSKPSEKPNINSSMNAAHSVIDNNIVSEGSREYTTWEGIDVIYENHEIRDGTKRYHLLFAMWYDNASDYYFIYTTQSATNTAYSTFTEFLDGLKLNRLHHN